MVGLPGAGYQGGGRRFPYSGHSGADPHAGTFARADEGQRLEPVHAVGSIHAGAGIRSISLRSIFHAGDPADRPFGGSGGMYMQRSV